MPIHLQAASAGLIQYLSPTPIPAPYAVAFSKDCAKQLGIQDDLSHPELLSLLAGNQTHYQNKQCQTYAMAYSGHQFGVWAGQLGDGRAIYLGDWRQFEVQLKGAGPTDYSRRGDGRAVLRSSIREFLCSEAMYHLGIPTSRALAVVGSDLPVRRETIETAAVCTRVAPSFLRIGHIEHYGHNDMQKELENTLDYLIAHHYPDVATKPYPYLALLEAIAMRTGQLAAQWQAVGFCHGVLNTDNTSLLGLTLDYGPFGFLDQFDREHICNHSDEQGRYSYHRQPDILQWNLYCLASAMLLPLKKQLQLDEEAAIERIKSSLDVYAKTYRSAFIDFYRQKLGFQTAHPEDLALIEQLLQLMHHERLDYTLFFRELSEGRQYDAQPSEALLAWLALYQTRIELENMAQDQRLAQMQTINPKYVLRNHLAQNAIERAQAKDFREVARLLKILENPYEEQSGAKDYALPPPADHPPICVSCSS